MKKGDHVTGRIYEISNNFGAFVAVDDCYSGLIPKREAAEHYQVGEVLSLRVTAVKADGKLDLSSRERDSGADEPGCGRGLEKTGRKKAESLILPTRQIPSLSKKNWD